ncbi:MAG TPA: hypothetical protein VNN08_04845 [Thermoanaerobaculia bacterium]|nr:hypothetical protein [Thermoanaerobaculia bacterium]
MKTCARLILVIVVLLVPTVATQGQSAKKVSKPTLALCPGPFALCAASTCKPTGRKYPGTKVPEVVCECPVLQGPSLADLSGEMQGSCKPPVDSKSGKTGIWSLYSTAASFPQKIDGAWQKDVAATPQNCPAKGGQPSRRLLYGQCFSYSCKDVREADGVPIADCYCPALTVIDPNRQFATQAGQCQQSVCTEIPVGGPFVLPPGTFCEKSASAFNDDHRARRE